jgi:hypothetical protein
MKLVSLFQPDDGLRDRIRQVEDILGAPLPQDYVEFLQRMNGASLSNGEDFGIELNDGSYTDLCVLYGSGEGVYNAARLEYWLNRRPQPKSLIVGSDSGGNIFWLSLLPQDYGTVYFKQDDYPQADGPVAKWWSAFLELQNDTD